VWPCLFFSNYAEMINRLGSVLPEEKWSEVQKKLSIEFQRYAMSNYTRMNVAINTPAIFLLGVVTPFETDSMYGTWESVCIGTLAFNDVVQNVQNLEVNPEFHSEEFSKAIQQMFQISQMAEQWQQEAPQEPPTAPVATENSAITENSKPLEATLVMDEDESLAGVGKGKRKKPEQAPTEPKVAAFETPGTVATKGQGGDTSSVGPPTENPSIQEEETETEYPMEEENDDEEKSGESNNAASAATSAVDLDSQSVKTTSKKQKVDTKRKGETSSKLSAVSKRPKPNSPPQVDEDEGTELRIIIPTFTEAKPLLEKAGYTFREGVYCRPKGDPKKYSDKVEGNDYFATESAFREFLLRTGVDCNGTEWTAADDKANVLTRWIRYNVIKSCKDETVLPSYDLTSKHALDLLKKLNFRHSWDPEQGYKLPGVTKKEAKQGVNKFPEMPDLWVYLARHGLPDNCPFEKITPSERLALEQFIAGFESEDIDL
jgi:hypothetical protein